VWLEARHRGREDPSPMRKGHSESTPIRTDRQLERMPHLSLQLPYAGDPGASRQVSMPPLTSFCAGSAPGGERRQPSSVPCGSNNTASSFSTPGQAERLSLPYRNSDHRVGSSNLSGRAMLSMTHNGSTLERPSRATPMQPDGFVLTPISCTPTCSLASVDSRSEAGSDA
jgi:hypothetical protein